MFRPSIDKKQKYFFFVWNQQYYQFLERIFFDPKIFFVVLQNMFFQKEGEILRGMIY